MLITGGDDNREDAGWRWFLLESFIVIILVVIGSTICGLVIAGAIHVLRWAFG